jgi:hypothetical protein
MRSERQQVRDQLHTAWLRKLAVWWSHYNEEYLDGVLRTPLISLSDAGSEWGHWEPRTRRLSISAPHIEREPWLEVMETLRHEMAHQYVDEHLRPVREKPHGETFARACEQLRCDPAGASSSAAAQDERVLRVLKKILSLTSSPNENEAENAVKKAQLLLLQYNIDMVDLDRERNFSVRSLGPIKGRRASFELWMAMILHEFFFVEVLWAKTYDAGRDKKGTVLQVYGTPTNLEMAAYVYEYLSQLIGRLWQQYRCDQQLKANRERQRYYAGVLEGFYHKLIEQDRKRCQEQALVWKGDDRLNRFYRHINPRVVTSYGRGVRTSVAYADGLSAGREVEIRRPITADAKTFGGFLKQK